MFGGDLENYRSYSAACADTRLLLGHTTLKRNHLSDRTLYCGWTRVYCNTKRAYITEEYRLDRIT